MIFTLYLPTEYLFLCINHSFLIPFVSSIYECRFNIDIDRPSPQVGLYISTINIMKNPQGSGTLVCAGYTQPFIISGKHRIFRLSACMWRPIRARGYSLSLYRFRLLQYRRVRSPPQPTIRSRPKTCQCIIIFL